MSSFNDLDIDQNYKDQDYNYLDSQATGARDRSKTGEGHLNLRAASSIKESAKIYAVKDI